MTTNRGKATVTKRGDVTTVRVVDYRNKLPEPELPAVELEKPPDLDNLKVLDLVEFNRAAETAFLKMLNKLCDQMPDGVSVRGLRAEAAYSLGISTETAKRYIEKYCVAFSAPFALQAGVIKRKGSKNEPKTGL